MKLFILHFQPLEGYPPIMNLVEYFARKELIDVSCYTVSGAYDYQFKNSNVKIKRLGRLDKNSSRIFRGTTYLLYNLGSLCGLIFRKPSVVLYYETISAWPAYVYKRFINRKSRIFVHYHEYSNPKEYQSGMALVKYFHDCEQEIYPQVEWISHTNAFRKERFINDLSTLKLKPELFHVVHNYPPANWISQSTPLLLKNELRMVYVGYSLSLDTMYVKELFNWIKDAKSKIVLDCYLHDIPEGVLNYISVDGLTNIRIHPSIKYTEIPAVLKNYNVGLILYNGAIENYIYNETNKLFEYLACGLDVWFPKVMLGTLPHVCIDDRPRVLALDFENLDQYKAEDLITSSKIPKREINYTCEAEYEKLYKAIMNES